MRIGVEMFGTQSAGRHRGVGRYVRNLASALVALAPGRGHEIVFYAEGGTPTDLVPDGPDAPLRLLQPTPTLRDAVGRVVTDNPDGLDALLLLNPLELTPGYDVPSRPTRSHQGMKIAAVVYDLIPMIFPDDYLRRWPAGFARRYTLALHRLRAYDRLLAISEATRTDLIRKLGVPPGQVTTIGAAADDRSLAFTPGTPEAGPADRSAVARLGLDRPFVLSLGAGDPRKNLDGLIEAFALLPGPLRLGHTLAIAGTLGPEREADLYRRAAARGLNRGTSFALLGPVDDATLRALYRRCAAFAFPSRYEGFGLPVLEALACGAAVVAGRNSSIVEVAGRAAVLVNVSEPASIADSLTRVLTNPTLARALRDAGPARSRKFSWNAVAARTLDALERTASRQAGLSSGPLPTRDSEGEVLSDPLLPMWGRVGVGGGTTPYAHCRMTPQGKTTRPRVALVSPLPPNPCGVADYAASLVGPLAAHVTIDLFHDAGEVPFARFLGDGLGVGCHDHRLFDRLHRLRPYAAIVYQMGNSPAHIFVYEMLLMHPGVVALHDLALASFHYERSARLGLGPSAFVDEFEHSHPGRASGFGGLNARWRDDPARLVGDLGRAGLDMNRRAVERARALVVHSPAAAERAAGVGPGVPRKTFVIPHGAEPAARPAHPADRSAARDRLGLSVDGLILGQFGMVHTSKMNAEAVGAFAAVAAARRDALMLIVGDEADGGLARRRVEALGLAGRVRFWGRPDDDEFHSLVAAVDLGLCLRRPPTNGETSGALLHLLRAGVATVVIDAGSFAEFPRGVVRKVAWRPTAEGEPDDPENLDALRRAITALAHDPAARAALGRSAWEHVRDRRAWPLVAAAYADVIDWTIRQNRSYRGPHHGPAGIRAGAERGER